MLTLNIVLFSTVPEFVRMQSVTGCSLAYVEDDTTLVGFDVDDVCVETTV